MYEDFIYNARYYFPILTFIVFASLLFDKESRFSSIVLVSVCIIFFLMPDIDSNQSKEAYKADFLTAMYLTTSYNVGAMLALMFRKDKLSQKHAKYFFFVILLLTVISLKVIHGFHWWNYHFVIFHNEILILIALLQIRASKDGLIRIYHGMEGCYSRVRGYISIYQPEVTRTQAESKGK